MKDALVIILHDHPWEHTSDYVNQTASYVSKKNCTVSLLLKDPILIQDFFVRPLSIWFIKKPNSSWFLIRPISIIPLRRKSVVRINIWLNMMLMRMYFSMYFLWRKHIEKYIWVFNPEHYAAIKIFGPRYQTVYDCVDYHSDPLLQRDERLLLRESTHVFVNSHTLYALHKQHRADIHVVPLGFDRKRFEGLARSTIRLPSNIPIIGYIGGINSRLNFSLLFSVIEKNPYFHFVFVGPKQDHESDGVFDNVITPKIDALFAFSNVTYIPWVGKRDIAQVLKTFRVCIIPYDVSDPLNTYCFPMKVMEYFYAGKPILSTDILELRRYSKFIQIGSTEKQWSMILKKLTSHLWHTSLQKIQKTIAEDNAWEKKLKTIYSFLRSS